MKRIIALAVALGAQAVLIGRPTLYAAAAGGAEGVERCLQILLEDMHRTLAQIGRSSIQDVDADCLADTVNPTSTPPATLRARAAPP